MARPLTCPVHHMPDCSPLLNGCHLVNQLAAYDRNLVDSCAEAVEHTYTLDGVEVWWLGWQHRRPEDRHRWLEHGASLSGQVAT